MLTDRTALPPPSRDGRTLAGFVSVRLLANTYLRFPYVFIDSIAKGLGVPLTTVTTILGLRELGGIVSPLIGRSIDRGHLRRGLIWSGVIAGVSGVVGVAVESLWWFAALMFIGGAAKISVDIAQNVWIGRKIPLARRARVVGLVEASWAGAFLLGAPVLGLVIEWYGWRAAFVATGTALVVATLGTVGLDRSVGVSDGSEHSGGSPVPEVSGHVIDEEHRPRRSHTRRRAILGFNVFQPVGQMAIFAVNGDWFADRLGMTPAAIGSATIVLGVGELAGTALVAAVTDRIGAARSGILGMSVAAPLMLLLVTNPEAVWVGVLLLALMNIAIEFAFVSVLPLMSEMGTDDRGSAFGQALTVNTVSRAFAAIVAGFAYTWGGIAAAGILGAASTACGAIVLAHGTTPRSRP